MNSWTVNDRDRFCISLHPAASKLFNTQLVAVEAWPSGPRDLLDIPIIVSKASRAQIESYWAGQPGMDEPRLTRHVAPSSSPRNQPPQFSVSQVVFAVLLE